MKKIILGLLFFNTMIMNAQTQIIAHRGFWKTNPETTENSITALKNAQRLGVYGSEFDVRMTKDGFLVVNHDEHHNKMEISETNFEDLNSIKLENGENLPKLEDYLKQGLKNKKVKLIVEIKPAKTKELEDEIVAKSLKIIKDLNLEKQCEFISFSLNICKEIKHREPKFIVQYLNGELSPQELKNENLDGLDYHYPVVHY
ncbi:glycerophosphodiester phosphodiesterase family protein [Chryseobacterium sp.]|uniref:glycerophosphodiester phosphodiesterase family protein n=1 Tax=Chryseobacterium sp. TaxID=1871047 RepID=UPI00388F2B2D